MLRKRIDKSVLVGLGVLLWMAPLAARAAPSCHGLSATAIIFPNYDVYYGSDTDGTTTITYNCPPPALPTVTITGGNSGLQDPRWMIRIGSPDTLLYNLYSDPARSQIWGSTAVSVAQGNNGSVTVYGRIFKLQDVSVGAYSDSL